MAFGQYSLEMEVLVPEALRNTVDCRCSSETLEPSPCTSGQTTIEILQLKVNLHSIRFSYVFVRFFTFLLLLEKVCAFSSAFL